MPIQKRTIGEIPYTIIPNVIFELRNAEAIAIWCYLHSKPENWIIRKTDIRKTLGLGDQRYNKAITLLKEAGLFSTATAQNPETGRLEGSVGWLFMPDHRDPLKPIAGKPDSRETPTLGKTDHIVSKDSLVSKELLVNKEKPLKPNGFEKFWSAYPKKKNKQQAIKAFKAQRINGELQTILDDIEDLKNTNDWMREGGQFIPYPSSYLNGRRWEDERTQTSGEPF